MDAKSRKSGIKGLPVSIYVRLEQVSAVNNHRGAKKKQYCRQRLRGAWTARGEIQAENNE